MSIVEKEFFVCSACGEIWEREELNFYVDGDYEFFYCSECGYSTLTNLRKRSDEDVWSPEG